VLREQPQTAVYLNAHGDLVIRQRGDSYEDDPYILIAIHNVARVARAMLEMAGLEIIPTVERSSSTNNAERQRRYRERNANRNANRNGESNGGLLTLVTAAE